jgi:MFS family permease
MTALTSTATREVRDFYGRRYHVGESARDLIGHSRRWQAWSAWACMAAISQLQYAFGVAALGMRASHGWSTSETMWLLALFVACQAMVAIPVAWIHRGRHASPSQLTVAGGALAAIGMLTLAHAGGFAVAAVGFALVGGVGAGLVYSTCVATAAKWFPDKRVATIGFVTGGFACGAVPCIALLTLFSSSRGHTVVLDVAALMTLVIVTVCGLQLKDPPPHWWPQGIDAQLWAVDRHLNPSLPNNTPAVRHYAPGQAMRTGSLPLMWLILALISAVSLFGIAFLASYAVAANLGVAVAGLAAGLLATVNGLGRSYAGRLSDRFGRRKVLAIVLAVGGFTQFGFAFAGAAGNPWAFVVCATLAGVGGGAFYAILGNLVLEYFGENSLLQNQAILYSAKAVGGLVGVGGAAFLVAIVGYGPLFVAAGLIGLATATMVRFLKQPGRPALPVRSQLGTPVLTEAQPASDPGSRGG